MTCRFVICIPVYNNPLTIVTVIESCLNQTTLPVVVVDDGSTESVEGLYREKHQGVDPRISFVRHAANQGKGVALQSGFRWALDNAYTHMVTLDGDDQHDPADVVHLVAASEQNPFSLIIGERRMETANVPSSSVFGRAFSNFWIKYQTDVGVGDSQSGYRVYPLFAVQNMKFFCKKYDFEIEVLTRLLWKGVNLVNIPVSVKYFPPEKRVSHFDKFRDNVRLTILNTFLTIGAMFREQTSPFKGALAFGVGVFVGCTPLYGLHTGIVIIFSLIFRLNLVYLWLGSNIALPFFIPLLVWASNYLGHLVVPKGAGGFSSFSHTWFIGSLILGAILGPISSVIVYMVKANMLKKKTKTAWSGKNRNQAGVNIMRFILKTFGLRFAYFFLHFVVFYYFLFSWRARKSFSEYWKVLRPGAGFMKRQHLIYGQLMKFAQSLVDRGMQRTSDQLFFDYTIDKSVDQFMDNVRAKNRGALLVASHIGGWEMAMTFFAQLEEKKRMMAVMYGVPGQEAHQSRPAEDHRAEVVFFNSEQNTILKVKAHLEGGQIVGMMGDRPVTRSCELLPFFGKLALFDATPFRVAEACGAEVFFVFAVKDHWKRYSIYTIQPRAKSELPREERRRDLMAQYVSSLEEIVKRYPDQWFNFFPFWSEAPSFWES